MALGRNELCPGRAVREAFECALRKEWLATVPHPELDRLLVNFFLALYVYRVSFGVL